MTQDKYEVLEDMIDAWHLEDAGPDLELHEYLGLTPAEFANWAHTGQLPEDWEPPA